MDLCVHVEVRGVHCGGPAGERRGRRGGEIVEPRGKVRGRERAKSRNRASDRDWGINVSPMPNEVNRIISCDIDCSVVIEDTTCNRMRDLRNATRWTSNIAR